MQILTNPGHIIDLRHFNHQYKNKHKSTISVFSTGISKIELEFAQKKGYFFFLQSSFTLLAVLTAARVDNQKIDSYYKLNDSLSFCLQECNKGVTCFIAKTTVTYINLLGAPCLTYALSSWR